MAVAGSRTAVAVPAAEQGDQGQVQNRAGRGAQHRRGTQGQRGGRVEVLTTQTDGHAVIRVGNTGTVIPPAELDRLFQPFQQRGRERICHGGGHGLGLAIVRAIASARKATITATARPEGGLDVEVSFP